MMFVLYWRIGLEDYSWCISYLFGKRYYFKGRTARPVIKCCSGTTIKRVGGTYNLYFVSYKLLLISREAHLFVVSSCPPYNKIIYALKFVLKILHGRRHAPKWVSVGIDHVFIVIVVISPTSLNVWYHNMLENLAAL